MNFIGCHSLIYFSKLRSSSFFTVDWIFLEFLSIDVLICLSSAFSSLKLFSNSEKFFWSSLSLLMKDWVNTRIRSFMRDCLSSMLRILVAMFIWFC